MKIVHLGLCVSPPPINGLQKAFINNCDEYQELNCGNPDFNNLAVNMANSFKPDLVFIQIQAPGIIDINTVNAFRGNGAFVVNWTGDVRNEVPPWMTYLPCDLTCFSNMRDVHELRKYGIKSEYLEIGYDPEIYKPEGETKLTNEIVFFGNNYGNQFPEGLFRAEMVNHLKRVYGDRFGVYGTGWQNANGNYNHSQIEEAAAYRGAKIAINCSHYNIERYSSDRLLRILGTGVPLCLTKDYPGIENDYIHNQHLVCWEGFSDLEIKINHYLQNEEQRLKIVKNANELVKEKFTFDMMVKNLIKLYNEYK